MRKIACNYVYSTVLCIRFVLHYHNNDSLYQPHACYTMCVVIINCCNEIMKNIKMKEI